MLVEKYGEVGAGYILTYVWGSSENKFSTVEELWEVCKDKYTPFVTQFDPKTVDELMNEFPDEEMFKFFKKEIDKVS
jgi:hypothetical protein